LIDLATEEDSEPKIRICVWIIWVIYLIF